MKARVNPINQVSPDFARTYNKQIPLAWRERFAPTCLYSEPLISVLSVYSQIVQYYFMEGYFS
jgi:hypothetical protein